MALVGPEITPGAEFLPDNGGADVLGSFFSSLVKS
jgi:hypothetical protein